MPGYGNVDAWPVITNNFISASEKVYGETVLMHEYGDYGILGQLVSQFLERDNNFPFFYRKISILGTLNGVNTVSLNNNSDVKKKKTR